MPVIDTHGGPKDHEVLQTMPLARPRVPKQALRKLTTRQQRFAFARLPDPHLTRSSPRLFRSAHHERHLTDAACGGLEPPPAGRPRRTYLHLSHSTAFKRLYINASFSVRGTRAAETCWSEA